MGRVTGAMDRPNFLVIGAAQSGTTSLYHWLGQHPDVLMSRAKEPRFFDKHYDRGLGAYWREHFSGWAGQHAVGEATPSYLYLPFVAGRIARDLPDVRLIAVLRNPVDRAYASWWATRTVGADRRSFERALFEECRDRAAGITIEGPDGERLWRAHARATDVDGMTGLTNYLASGHYAECLRRYTGLFPPDRLKVLLLEELVADPAAVVRGLWAFLGVDDTITLADPGPRNEAYGAVAARLYASSGRRALILKAPPALRGAARRWLTRWSPRPAMHPETRRWLVDYFAGRNRELETLLGRDLSGWTADSTPP